MSSLSLRSRAALLIAAQCVIVASIAAKYQYERSTCPRVWVKTSSIDPNMPVRGRYLWLPVEVNACELKPSGDSNWTLPNTKGTYRYWAVSLAARGDQLVAYQNPNTPLYRTVDISAQPNQTCDEAWLTEGIPYFIPDTAGSPFPLKAGQQLWVQVTVPPAGPPRAVQLAIRQDGKLRPLNLE